MSRFTFVFLCAILLLPVLSVGGETAKVAVLGFENLNRDPRYDYLEGMIVGVLMYDLIRIDDIELVERARMDRIFDEQELRLSGLLRDADTAKQVGLLAGADALIEGDYAFLGREMIVNVSLMKVDDGRTIPFSVRGYTENSIHELAEMIVEELTGEPVILAGVEGERSLLSLSDEEPGSVEFYCNFQQGEILVDEEFYGYTPGGTTPTLLEDLSPGEHTIRVEAGPNFGEVEWPQIEFKDWERTVTVKAGRKIVVRATVRHFNDILYSAMNIFREQWRLEPGKTEVIDFEEDISFQDRDGSVIPARVKLNAEIVADRPVVRLEAEIQGETRVWNLPTDPDEIEIEEKFGLLDVDFERDWYNSSYWDLDLWIQRTDIRQGMHRE